MTSSGDLAWSAIPVGSGSAITDLPWKLSFWMYDSTATRSFVQAQDRTGGTYSGALNQIFAIGKYNTVTMPGEAYSSTKYQGRILYPSATYGWFQLNAPSAPNRSTGWHKFDILGGYNDDGTRTLTFYVDGKVGREFTDSASNFGLLPNVLAMGFGSGTTAGNAYFDGFTVVQGIPYISTKPQGLSVNAGREFTLTANANGNPTLYYQWQHAGTNLPGATDASYTNPNSAQTDSGTYTLIVTNELDSASVSVTVTITPPITITVPLTNQVVNPNTSATFYAEATGSGTLYFTWKHGTTVLYESTGTSSSYTINSVTPSDAGSYSVTVTNDVGDPAETSSAILTVNLPPALTSATNQAVIVNTKVSIRMRATDDLSSESTPFQAFEAYGNGTHVMFCQPSFSGGSVGVDTSQANFSYVTNGFPAEHGSARVLNSRWTWTNSSGNGLRFTTASTGGGVAIGGSPIISYTNRLRFDIHCDRDIQVGLGVRDSSPTGAIGTTDTATSGQLEWIGVSSSTPTRTVTGGAWATLDFDPLTDPLQSAYGVGNGVLNSTTGKGTLEHLYLRPGDGQPNPYALHLDNFVVVAYHPITFSLDSGPAGATIDQYTGVITWNPTAIGPTDFSVTASDYLGLTDTKTFTVTANIALNPVTLSNIVGTALSYGGGSGSQFVLLQSSNVNAPLDTWARMATNTVTPGSFTISTAASQVFYRVKSE